VSSSQESVIDSQVSSRGGLLSSSATRARRRTLPTNRRKDKRAPEADTYRASRPSWGASLMLLVIAFIVATISLAALEVWLFWKLGEKDDRRRGRERPNAQASKAPVTTRERPLVVHASSTPGSRSRRGRAPSTARPIERRTR
jgi:cytochrome c-type biogenesis protein CcmH/NrfG